MTMPSGGALPPGPPGVNTPTSPPPTPPTTAQLGFTPPFRLGYGKPGVFTDSRQQIAGGGPDPSTTVAPAVNPAPAPAAGAGNVGGGGALNGGGGSSNNVPDSTYGTDPSDISGYPFVQQEQQANKDAFNAGRPQPYPGVS